MTSTMRVCLTGFPPFPIQPVNPTQQLVDAVQRGALDRTDLELSAFLLPVEYVGVETEFERLVEEQRPDLILSFGVGRQTELFRLERIGRNLDNTQLPDNAGEVRIDTVINPNAADSYESSINLESLAQAVRTATDSVIISNNAGAYLCNHLNFLGLHAAQHGNEFRFLFTHVCAVENGFDLNNALRGVDAMLDWFLTSPCSDT